MINSWAHWVFEWDDSSDMIILGNLEPIALPILFNPSQSVPTLLETFQTNPEKNLLQISSLCRVQMVLTIFPGISNTKRLGEILRGIWILRWAVLNLLHRVNQADFGLFYGWRSVGDKRYVSPPPHFHTGFQKKGFQQEIDEVKRCSYNWSVDCVLYEVSTMLKWLNCYDEDTWR